MEVGCPFDISIDYFTGMNPYPDTATLNTYFQYLELAIQLRLEKYFQKESETVQWANLPLPEMNGQQHPLPKFIKTHQLTDEELILLLIALAPHVYPDFFDRIIREKIPEAGDFPEFGGVRGKQFRGFLPTAETALFILAGNDLKKRFEVKHLFNGAHFFAKARVLWLEEAPAGEPVMSGKLVIDQDYVDLFTIGKVSLPQRTMSFPAEHLSTEMEWEDLVLPAQTWAQIREIEVWIKHHSTLMQDWGMHRKLKPGYRALFYGPPGTGKTLTANLLGKYTQREVFKIDLSMVVSKYIGETEKNLASLFDRAQNKDWILFFDEADSVFGKRTNVRDAHDKYANQEVSYLLQRIENYQGLAILASNFKSNIDEAFTRRFQAIIHFPIPKPEERLVLWQKAFPAKVQLEEKIDLFQISKQFELSGSNIMNIVQYCCLVALDKGTGQISLENLLSGIKREFLKEGKTI